MAEVTRGIGSPEMLGEMMDFLDLVFGFTGKETTFIDLHPKLYKAEYYPCENNYMVWEDGAIKAAIGAYDTVLDVAGEQLKVTGIGNVAVHPDSRSKGYMVDCMERSLADMKKKGCDISTLGGQRQRYQYFSYEPGGAEYKFKITDTNLRHTFRRVPFRKLDFVKVERENTELVKQIMALHDKSPLRMVRPSEMFYDILKTWNATPWAILKDGEFAGYFINRLGELTLVDNSDFDDVIRNYGAEHEEFSMVIPLWKTKFLQKAFRIAENVVLGNSEQFTVLNYRKVLGAFLRFKAAYDRLNDGQWTVLIHGYAGDECLRLTVKDNVPAVEEFAGPAETELSHMDAFTAFFGVYSPVRGSLPTAVQGWFPLPLYVESADRV